MSATGAAANLLGDTLPVTAEQFCEQYAPAVCRFAAMAAKSSSEAEDIAQEAILHAVRRLDTFDPSRGEIGAWMWRIVANVARDHQRAERRRFAIWARLSRVREAAAESVESIAIDHIDNQRLLASVRGLEPRDRTLLALRFGADLDLRAVGRALSMSDAAAGRAVLRALDKLRRQLEVKP
jgi:RNA polymerase sigma factor (sigma-70 family)